MFIHVNGVQLYYQVQGSGRPLLLLHGNGESHAVFDQLARRLSAQYTVYALDSRGHGRSTGLGAGISYRDMAADVLAFIRALQLEKPILLGFSDGGIVGLMAAMEQPRLLGALIACGANLSPKGLRPLWLLLFRLVYLFTRSELVHMMLTQPSIPPEALSAIQAPTLILAGQFDLIRQKHTRLIAAHIPGSRLQLLPREGHGSYLVHTDKAFPTVTAFLEEALKPVPEGGG